MGSVPIVFEVFETGLRQFEAGLVHLYIILPILLYLFVGLSYCYKDKQGFLMLIIVREFRHRLIGQSIFGRLVRNAPTR